MGRLRDLLNGGATPTPAAAPELKQGADPVVEQVPEVKPVGKVYQLEDLLFNSLSTSSKE